MRKIRANGTEENALVTRRPAEEIARLGERIFERDIRHEVEDLDDWDIVAIDVETGKWTVAGSELGAWRSLREHQSDAINVWMRKVGSRAIGHMGGRSLLSGW